MNTFRIVFVSFFTILSLASCDEQSVRSDSEIDQVMLDSSKTSFVNVSGKLFSIPSPVQTAMLIKESGAEYDRTLLSNPSASENSATKNVQALNLGMYGADMAYASLYDDAQTAIKYFRSLEKLAESLGIKGALNPSLVKRLSANVGEPDSLLLLSGKFYQQADAYLKENERIDIATMVLAGGWIESAYITSQVAQSGNKDAKKRLGAQKKSVSTLCEVLKDVADDEFNTGLTMKSLDSLKMAYDGVVYSYTYSDPITEKDRKRTRITSKSSYEMTEEQLNTISKIIANIRSQITTQG